MPPLPPFQLIAGNLALDFANTLDNRYSPKGQIELLSSYGDLLRFAAQSKVFTVAQVRGPRRPIPQPRGATSGAKAAVLRSAIRLREAIERIFRAIAQDNSQANGHYHFRRLPRRAAGKADAASLAILNGYLKDALAHRRIAPVAASASGPISIPVMVSNGAAFAWKWVGEGSNLAAPFWPIAIAAAELLASRDLALVRECRSHTCRWLFLDTSKNHSRRWCDMGTCGNRLKARRYYRKRSGFPLI